MEKQTKTTGAYGSYGHTTKEAEYGNERTVPATFRYRELTPEQKKKNEIEGYLDSHFLFTATAETEFDFYAPYEANPEEMDIEFEGSTIVDVKMKVNLIIRATGELVTILVSDIEKSIHELTNFLIEKGMPTAPEQIRDALIEFGLSDGIQLVKSPNLTNDQKLEVLESVLHVSLVTKGLDHEKPNAAMVGAFSFRFKDGRVFRFDYEHAKILQGFEADGSFHMSFRLNGLHKDFMLEANDELPQSWEEVFEGELEEVSYEVLDEFDLPVRCELVEFILLDRNREWHMVPYDVLDKVNEKQNDLTK